ncbi:hypothetical protein KGV55_01860 [Candidatus Gracilibacteria bacterium]|nr:hypothetical protein [Candidatus Gracilibacteria bacterium]
MTNIMHDDYHGFGKLGEGYGGYNKISEGWDGNDSKVIMNTKGKVVKTLDEGYRNNEEGYRNPVEWV